MTDKSRDETAMHPKVKQLLAQPVLAQLATVSIKTLQPHVVPVWFYWDYESVWVSSYRSTRKVKGLGAAFTCVTIRPSSAETNSENNAWRHSDDKKADRRRRKHRRREDLLDREARRKARLADRFRIG